MEEGRIDDHSERGLEAETDIRDAEGRVHARVPRQELRDATNRLDAGLPELLIAGAQSEGEAVHEDIVVGHAIFAGHGEDALGDFDLLLPGLGHAVLVNGERDDARAILLTKGENLARARLAILEIDAVDDGLAGQTLQGALDNGDLGGVNHDRHRDFGVITEENFAHISDFVAPDVRGADVEDMRTLPFKLAGEFGEAFPVLRGEHFLERPRAIGVSLLADDKKACILMIGLELVEAAAPNERETGRLLVRIERKIKTGERFAMANPMRGSGVLGSFESLAHCLDMFGRGAAATAAHSDAELIDEALVMMREVFGAQFVDGLALFHDRQAGIGLDADRARAVLPEETDVLGHFDRAGGAIHAERDDFGEALEHIEGRADFGADQHGAGLLHGDLNDDRLERFGLRHGALRRDNARLDHEQVLQGFEHEDINAALDQPDEAALIGFDHLVPLGLAKADELRPRA